MVAFVGGLESMILIRCTTELQPTETEGTLSSMVAKGIADSGYHDKINGRSMV